MVCQFLLWVVENNGLDEPREKQSMVLLDFSFGFRSFVGTDLRFNLETARRTIATQIDPFGRQPGAVRTSVGYSVGISTA